MAKREASESVNKPPPEDGEENGAEFVPKRRCISQPTIYRQTNLSVEAPTLSQMMSSNIRSAQLSLNINLVPALCGWSYDDLQYKIPPAAPDPNMPFMSQGGFAPPSGPPSPVAPFGFPAAEVPEAAPIPHNYPIMVVSPMKIAQEAMGAPTNPIEDYYWNLFITRGDILPYYQTKYKGVDLGGEAPSGTKTTDLMTVKIEPPSPTYEPGRNLEVDAIKAGEGMLVGQEHEIGMKNEELGNIFAEPEPENFVGDNMINEELGVEDYIDDGIEEEALAMEVTEEAQEEDQDPTEPSWFEPDLTISMPSEVGTPSVDPSDSFYH